MRSSVLAVLALSCVALSDASLFAQRGRRVDFSARRHGWLFSLAEGRRQAARSGKPLMVVLRCVP